MEANQVVKQAEECLRRRQLDQAEDLCGRVLGRWPACVPAHQVLARVALARGDQDAAQRYLARRAELPHDSHYARWGMLAEEAGDLNAAVAVYSEHLQRDPQHPGALFRLGMLLLERGERPRALQLLVAATKAAPDFAPAFLELAQCYADDALWGLAVEAYRRGLQLDGTNTVAQAGLALAESSLQAAAALPQPAAQPTGDAARWLYQRFAGREQVHARQWIDAAGRVGYSPVHEPLDERLLGVHLRGDVTLGVYPLRSDGTVLFGALDIDVRRGALRSAGEAGQLSPELQAKVRQDAQRLQRLAESLRVPLYAEDSGFKGMHLWLFLSQPVPAAKVKRFLEAVVQRCGPASPELQWEVFPKQERVDADQLGNLIKIPLGVHRKSGRRCLFVDMTGQAYADQTAHLAALATVAPGQLDEAAGRLVQPPAEGGPVSSVAELEAAHPDFAVLFARCGVIRALVEKAVVTHHLSHDERLALKCVLVHAGERGRALVHAVIGQCLDYSARLTQQQIEHTPPSPVSCPKLRQRLPSITTVVDCACRFDLPAGGYPSPVLHLDPQSTRGKSQTSGRQAALIERYVALRRQLQQLRADMEQVEADVRHALETGGGDELRAGGWLVRKEADERLIVQVDPA
jgi:tetratricopeptide (TPR) repeat protein